MTLSAERDLEPWERELIVESMSLPGVEELPTLARELKRIDNNFLRFEQELVKLRKRPPRARWKTGAAARVNPDRIEFAWVIIGINVIFLLSAMAASFAGQIAAAPATHLASYLYGVIPVAIDLPIISASFMAAIYRKRKQYGAANGNWVIVGLLTTANIVIQFTHTVGLSGGFSGRTLTVTDWVGVGIMCMMPLLVFYTSENLGRLLVKPTGEARETPAPAPAKRTTTRKRK